MASPYGEDILEDVPIDDFQGTTLRIEPLSAQHSRSVTPNQNLTIVGEEALTGRPVPMERHSEGNFNDYKKSISVFNHRPVLQQTNSDPSAEILSPPSPDSVENAGFYSSQGLSRSFYKQPPIGKERRASWHADTGLDRGIYEFFSVRVGALDAALEECRFLLDPELDGDIKGTWLLTEINHWDIEKERVIILCDFTLLIIKYDFIALHHVYYTRIQLRTLEKLEHGEVTYPSHSLVPRISGIAGGVVTVLRGVIFNRLTSTLSRLNFWRPKECPRESGEDYDASDQPPVDFSLSSVSFEPRWRNMPGVRVTWNSNSGLTFSQRWNPFCKNIPFTTFTSHPLYWYSGCENKTYDVKCLFQELTQTLEKLQDRPDTATICPVISNAIVIENYVGIASLLHNVSELGFFKLRGRVSF